MIHKIGIIYLFRFCQLGQGHHNSICQSLCALLPNPSRQLALWEETGVPRENPRLSAERYWLFTLFTWELGSSRIGKVYSLRLEPAASEVEGKCANHFATEAPKSFCRASCVFVTCELVLATIDTEIVVVLIFLVIWLRILFKSRSSYFTVLVVANK
jgi:hypothetical protein